MHLAEMNVARLRQPIDHPDIADFVANLDLVNGIADRSPGFVWRLKDDSGTSIEMENPFGDDRMLITMSVWETARDLEHFVWQTVHKKFYERKAEWFELLSEHHLVMWHVPPGHTPTVEEGVERLQHLRAHGASDHAFDWTFLNARRTLARNTG